MTNTITLPRSVVEQALEAIEYAKSKIFGRYNEDTVDDAQVALVMALEQPQVEQEPVAEVGVIGWKNHLPNSGTVVHWTALMPPLGTKLYTHPQPPRQPLTDEEIDRIALDRMNLDRGTYAYAMVFKFARAIEAAHGIKEQK